MRSPSKSSPNTPGFEIPDLELDAPPSRQPRPLVERRRSAAQPIHLPSLSTEAETHSPAEGAAAAGLELEASGESASIGTGHTMDQYFGASVGTASFGDGFDLDDEPMKLEAIATSVDTAPWPLGRHDFAKLDLTRTEIDTCADYGKADVPFYLAPSYTMRVLMQQRKLKRALCHLKNELLDREAERDQLLVDMVAELRPKLEAAGKFGALLGAMDSAEQQLLTQQKALAQVNQSLSAELDHADRELAELEALRTQQQGTVSAQQRSVHEATHTFKRHEAQLKRVQIEVRNIKHKAREALGPAGGEIPHALKLELEPLLQREQSLLPGTEAAQQALDSANHELLRCEQLVRETTHQMDAVRAKKRQAVSKHQKALDSENQGVQAAEDRHVQAARELGHAVLDLRGSIPVPREVLDRIQHADDSAARALLDVERHTRALDSYDRETYLLGLKLAMLPVIVVLALFVLRLVL